MKNLLTGALSPLLFALFMFATFVNVQSQTQPPTNDLDSLLVDEEQKQIEKVLENAA